MPEEARKLQVTKEVELSDSAKLLKRVHDERRATVDAQLAHPSDGTKNYPAPL
ncbi:MAG: hypothetical protein ACR652_24150 [Methylocystis sp.]|uniref:hypothetical protein n=1 Tax=Methylocystis sp. TaxID=1911079 RepID=UPI003DA4C745